MLQQWCDMAIFIIEMGRASWMLRYCSRLLYVWISLIFKRYSVQTLAIFASFCILLNCMCKVWARLSPAVQNLYVFPDSECGRNIYSFNKDIFCPGSKLKATASELKRERRGESLLHFDAKCLFEVFFEFSNFHIFIGWTLSKFSKIPHFLKWCPRTLSKLAISKVQKFE